MSREEVFSIEAGCEIRPAQFDDWPIIADFNTRLADETELSGLAFDRIVFNFPHTGGGVDSYM